MREYKYIKKYVRSTENGFELELKNYGIKIVEPTKTRLLKRLCAASSILGVSFEKFCEINIGN